MIKKKIFLYVAGFVALCFFMVPAICVGDDHGMKILKNIDISATQRNESYPSVSINPVNEEFMVLWNTMGKCVPSDTISYHSIDGRRVSTEGELLGEPFQLSPPEPGWKTLPKSAYNIFRNDYGVVFTKGPGFYGGSTYVTIIDDLGNPNFPPYAVYPTTYNNSHPLIVFNSVREEYLVMYNDKYVFDPADPKLDNVAFIVDKDGDVIEGPKLIGGPQGDQFNPQAAFNSKNGTYFVGWEDFRNVGGWMDPCDIYGALVDAWGDVITEVPIIDDHTSPNPGDQRVQIITYNPDANEYLVVWNDTIPILDERGIMGQIFGPDGKPKGPQIIVADGPGSQSSPAVVYVPKRKEYFMVWNDTRYDTSGNPWYLQDGDIFGIWLKKNGRPYGEFPICIKEGNQHIPVVAYDPVSDKFLIAWLDHNAPDDYPVIPGGGPMAVEMIGDVRGVIYGKPHK